MAAAPRAPKKGTPAPPAARPVPRGGRWVRPEAPAATPAAAMQHPAGRPMTMPPPPPPARG
eukprot:12200861-Alexandrium_andersonii.AAC.1